MEARTGDPERLLSEALGAPCSHQRTWAEKTGEALHFSAKADSAARPQVTQARFQSEFVSVNVPGYNAGRISPDSSHL